MEPRPGVRPGKTTLRGSSPHRWPRHGCVQEELNLYARRHRPLMPACLPSSTMDAWYSQRDSHPHVTRTLVSETSASAVPPWELGGDTGSRNPTFCLQGRCASRYHYVPRSQEPTGHPRSSRWERGPESNRPRTAYETVQPTRASSPQSLYLGSSQEGRPYESQLGTTRYSDTRCLRYLLCRYLRGVTERSRTASWRVPPRGYDPLPWA